MTHPKQLEDTLDCGNAQETWQELVHHLKARARQARQVFADLNREASDALLRAEEHKADAEGFDALAVALINANVDFPKTEKEA
jgi:hypothetical protein